jgi:hypothetical protein
MARPTDPARRRAKQENPHRGGGELREVDEARGHRELGVRLPR